MAIGSGFTGRMVLGQRPMRWADVHAYVRVILALLRGEDAEWEGKVVRMLQPKGFGAPRPVDVPVLIGADGPKGLAVADELGDGVFSAMIPTQSTATWRALLTFGTVLDKGEDLLSERVLTAAGPALAVVYHGAYERGGADAVDSLPGGQTWRQKIEAVPEQERHLAIHEGHLVEANVRDRPAVEEGSLLLPAFTMTGTPAEVRDRITELGEAGITEIAYQPAGPDIPRELAAFASATSKLD